MAGCTEPLPERNRAVREGQCKRRGLYAGRRYSTEPER